MDEKWHSLFLGPGMRMMQKFKFLHKILILIIIILIPMIMLAYFFHAEIKKVTDFAQGERDGIQYVLPLSEILIELTREISPDFSAGKIEEQIKIIDQNDKQLGEELKTTEIWQELKGLLQNKKPGTRQQTISKTLELIAKVGDSSGLVLDPDLDSYYIMDAGIVKYPDIISKTNQISSLAVEGLGKPVGTVQEQIEMAMIIGAVRSTFAGVQTGIQTAVKANVKLTDGLLTFKESENATTMLLKQVDQVIYKTDGAAPPTSQTIVKELQQSNDKNAIAYRLYLKQLDELITTRMQTVTRHEENIFIGMIGTLIVAMYLLFALYRSMNQAIMGIFTGTQKFANGDWREEISVISVDEFADISLSLNTVRGEIRPMIGEILHSAQQVAASSQELTASSQHLAQAANHVSLSVSQVASGASQQLQFVNKSIQAIEKMSVTIKQVADNTNLATKSSEQTAEAARKGTVTITTAIEQMTSIEEAVMNSASVVKKLGERSGAIGQIVDTIAGIAGQTNLLALNAAIEAARAGEQGRGFAVVAEEVRKLAEQSQEATKQIANLIAEIQEETGKAVTAMTLGTTVVKTGTEVVNTAGQAFNEIVQLIYQVSTQIHEISAAFENIASGNQEIIRTSHEIATTSKNAVAQTQNVSTTSDEQSVSMREIALSSQELSKLAEGLQKVVNFFKI